MASSRRRRAELYKCNYDEEPAKKTRTRTVMPLGHKVQVLNRLARGESAASLGRAFGVNESTIRTIRKAEAAVWAKYEEVSRESTSEFLHVSAMTHDHQDAKQQIHALTSQRLPSDGVNAFPSSAFMDNIPPDEYLEAEKICKKEIEEDDCVEVIEEPDSPRIPVGLSLSTPWSVSPTASGTATTSTHSQSQRTTLCDNSGRIQRTTASKSSTGNGETDIDCLDYSVMGHVKERLSCLGNVVLKLSEENGDKNVLSFLSKKLKTFSESTQQWVEDEVLKIYMEAKKRDKVTSAHPDSISITGIFKHNDS